MTNQLSNLNRNRKHISTTVNVNNERKKIISHDINNEVNETMYEMNGIENENHRHQL